MTFVLIRIDEAILMRTHNIPSCKRKIEKQNPNIPIMPPDLVVWLTRISSKYPCVEQFLWFQGVQAIEFCPYI